MTFFIKSTLTLTILLILLVFSSISNATTASSPKQINGHPYQILSSPKIKSTGIKLIGNSRGIKRINALLQKDFFNQMNNEISCVRSGNAEGRGFESTNKKSLIEWNNGYIVIGTDSIEDCGGVHPNYESYVEVFSLKTGEIENTRFWIKKDYQNETDPSLMHSEVAENSDLIGKLREKYLKLYSNEKDMKQAQECNDDVGYFLGRGNNWATSEGMVFKASGKYPNSACTNQVVLPFNEAIPFLSVQGKQAIQAFRK